MRPQKYMILKPAFLNDFSWDDVNLQEFRRWAHTKRIPHIAIGVQKMYAMRMGHPVPDYTIIAFSEYLGDEEGPFRDIPLQTRRDRYKINAIAEECEPLKESTRRPNPWRSSHFALLEYLTRHFDVPGEVQCEFEDDVAKAAELVVECVGRSYDPSLSGPAAIALGEQHMKRDVNDYAQLLMKLWSVNSVSILFTPRRQKGGEFVRDQQGKIVPAGVSVVAAITRDFYKRFRTGQAEDSDITHQDLLPKSKFLLGDALCDIDMITKKSKRSSYAVLNSICYQAAALTPPLGRNDLSIIVLAGTPEIEKSIKSRGYKPTGYTTRLTGKPIYEYTAPRMSVQNTIASIQYNALKLLLQIYQGRIEKYEDLIK